MKIAIISDIHGNYSALKAVAKNISNRKISNVICLGDVCGYYSKVNECIDLIKDITDNVIIGNHDFYLINNIRCPRSFSANICLDYQRKIISHSNIEWLRKFPTNSIYFGINCVHGGFQDYLDEYIASNKYFIGKTFNERFLVSVHTHIPFIYDAKNFLYCNVGSVGQPRDGDYRASFAIFDNDRFEIIRVDYDFKETQIEMFAAGFDEYIYKNLEYGIAIGKNPSSEPNILRELKSPVHKAKGVSGLWNVE